MWLDLAKIIVHDTVLAHQDKHLNNSKAQALACQAPSPSLDKAQLLDDMTILENLLMPRTPNSR